ncbi:MAG TPA: PA14 domain-containing protein [Verrucomicrobiae bacterium]|nr:PA14 domain-containing protein [Verrucomicrobiae bacterium]
MFRNVLTLWCLSLCAALPCAKAAGPVGVDGGWVVANNGGLNLSTSLCSNYTAAEVGVLRIEFRLVNGYTNWNSTMLGYYDSAINNARAAGIQVCGLIDYTSLNGSKTTWNANANESTGGNGDNAYVDAFATNVVNTIVQHFHDRIKLWEIWNEPNVTATYVYPSVYSWMVAKSWEQIHLYLQLGDCTVIAGAGDTNWLNSVFQEGNSSAVNSFPPAKSTYGGYPMDGYAQHIYIDGWEEAPAADIQNYIDLYHNTYAGYEGSGTTKGTYVTEFGWNAYYLEDCYGYSWSQAMQIQADDMATTFNTMFVGGSGEFVKYASWYTWQDQANGGSCNNTGSGFGVLDVNGNKKTDYSNFQFWEAYEAYYSNGTIDNNIQKYFSSHGGQAVMGNPYDNGGSAFVHSWGGANVQDYTGGTGSDKTVFDGSYGTNEINDNNGFRNFYIDAGGPGKFGIPKNNEYAISGGTQQDFANGSLSQTGNGIRWSGSLNGLYAQYYNGTNFNLHVLDKLDSTVNFNWTNPPVNGCGRNCYSVNWTGYVTPLYSQTYTFYTQSDDGVRLWVNGVELVNDWTIHGSKQDSGTIVLTAGQKYSIQMQYFQNYGGAVAQLSWSSSSQSKQIIPSSQLLPY